MFRSALRQLPFDPEAGMQVVAHGRLTVYEPRGDYQLLAETLEPKGVGALQIAFEQLKERLFQEGLFDETRKRPLPLVPQRIGIVTSPLGRLSATLFRWCIGAEQTCICISTQRMCRVKRPCLTSY